MRQDDKYRLPVGPGIKSSMLTSEECFAIGLHQLSSQCLHIFDNRAYFMHMTIKTLTMTLVS